MITGISLEGYPMALPAGVIASASVLLVGTYLLRQYVRLFLYKRQILYKTKALHHTSFIYLNEHNKTEKTSSLFLSV